MNLGDLIKLVILIHAVSSTTADITSSNITYTLYTRHFPLGIDTSVEQIYPIGNTDFDGLFKRTYFIVYGPENPSGRDSYYLKDYLLFLDDCNVFVVNWTFLAETNMLPRDQVVSLGDFMTEFVKAVVDSYKLLLVKTVFIASSLGAHAAGRLSSNLDNLINTIHALDPSDLGQNPFEFLNPSITLYLSVIHTNGGQKGIDLPFGQADYYPNGGKKQPGCGRDEYGDCAHERAILYFSESLIRDGFIARNCSSYDNYSQGLCDVGLISHLGTVKEKSRLNGTFFLETNDRSPYGKGS